MWVEHLHSISEWKLHNEIKRIREQLSYMEYFQSRTPRSMHWWEKRKLRKIAFQYYELMTYLMIDTVCLDERFRKGDWAMTEVLPQLIELGLQSELSKRIR
jgi:hypothetical protein